MSKHIAKITWARNADEGFLDNRYSRGHEWSFDGGLTVPASSSPEVVPLPYSVEANLDPEEALVASLSSCHMLFFLSFAARNKFVVDSYTDNASGEMGKDTDGRVFMTKVTLRPAIAFSGASQPTTEEIERMHHDAHLQCFVANTLRTDVIVETQTS